MNKRQLLTMSGRQWYIATLLFVVTLVNYIDRQILSVLAPLLRKDIHLTTSEYAFALNAFLLAYAFMYAGSGLILDRIGTRWGLALFLAAWSAVSALHAGVSGLWGLVVLRLLLGVFEPGGWTGGVKTIAERFTAAQRGVATGIFTSGSALATAVTTPLIVLLALRFGWRMAFLVPSVIGFLWLPFWLRATRPPPTSRSQGDATSAKPTWVERVRLLRKPPVLAYISARFFGDSSGYFFMFWLPDYLVNSRHFSFAMLGAVGWIPYLSYFVAPLMGGYASGVLIRRGRPALLSRKMVMTVAALIVAAGAAFQSATHTWALLLALSAAVFGVGVWASNLHAIPGDAFASDVVGTVYGVAGSAGAVGGILFDFDTLNWPTFDHLIWPTP